ncbi:4Fe-4S binding protein [Sulfurirhabdus autotrophica]|uniref:Polyferredoxin n=1 Tax=Sulfurirhabdus autotrophica TaxID=1706046 RepID=A0A4R3XUP4_9PROT|nr:4Fe-4S binding protein [Sulfurirhabdus autotrophica]TCV79187.1 polyferredoxin [Sulfurirhabdus autotrophica]
MNTVTEQISGSVSSAGRLARLGLAMRRYRVTILVVQWVIVLSYLALVAIPAFLPLPPDKAHIWNNLTRFAQFAFWGIWWPFVILSIMALGRVWCGVLCPEGALTEWVSKYGLGRGIPRWMKWGGWPFVAFVMTTVLGQMTSIYEYPKPALLILGGSTIAAIAVGLIWGREKRVWCKHLCPVSGVFGLLAKIAPVHFKVDQSAWDTAPSGHRTSRLHVVNCAPLINIRRMESASDCHMCGRCAGERDAVQLTLRSPGAEIISKPDTPENRAKEMDLWPARLLVFGMLGVALGAFQWSASPWLVTVKQIAAGWLIDHEVWWPLKESGHWWLLTYYPEANDVFTWLDGGLLLTYIAVETLVVGGWVWGWLRLTGALTGLPWQRLAQTLIPFAGFSVFVGLSMLTTSQLAGEGVLVSWAHVARIALLVISALWGASLAWRMAKRNCTMAAIGISMATVLPLAAWSTQFFVW